MSEAPVILDDLARVQNRLLLPQAVALARAGRYAQAEEWVRLILEREPSADAYCLLGKMYGQQARYGDARDALERALKVEPGHPEAGPALDCVKALTPGGSGVSSRTWKVVGVGAVLAGIAAATMFLRVLPGTPDTATASSVVAPPASDTGKDVNLNVLELMQAYAALASALQPLRPLTDIALHPGVTDGRAVVAVRGTVPSDYLRDEIERVLGPYASTLNVDTTAVQTTGRYTIRKGDTFTSIAAALCGRASLFTKLQSQNLNTVPDRMQPGSSIIVSCQ